jgi:CheY-like chemotaxis protein
MPATEHDWEFLRGLRILLVEDNPLISLDLETSLAERGAIVAAASSVGAALKILTASMLDFAVLDFELGLETSEPVAEAALARSLPFLYLSGYSEHDDRFARWPGIMVLAKPLSTAQIARGIQQVLLQSRRASRQPARPMAGYGSLLERHPRAACLL